MNLKILLAAAFSAAALLAAPQPALSDVVELPDGAAAQNADEAGQDAPRYYTVVKGDTLWDITHEFFKDPFKWPKVWRLNPYIRNPHLIYPGNVLRITPDGIEVVTPVEVSPEDLPVVGLEPEAEKVVVLEPPPEPEPVEPPPPPPMYASYSFARDGFIDDRELSESGAIIEAVEKQVLIGEKDRVYISFRDSSGVSEGDRFTIFKVGRRVRHPITGRKLGYIMEVLGSLTVTGTDEVIEAEIDTAYKEIEKGAKLKAYSEPLTAVEITEPASSVDGYVVAALEGQVESAAGDVVYVDKGTSDGVASGNLMRIFRKSRVARDPITGKKVTLPLIDVGALIVIEAKEKTSACLVIENLRSIREGDMVSTMRFEEAVSHQNIGSAR